MQVKKKFKLVLSLFLGLVFLVGCGSNKTENTSNDLSTNKMEEILSSTDVYKGDDFLMLQRNIDADSNIGVIFDLDKKDGNYIIGEGDPFWKYEIGKETLVTFAKVETGKNIYKYSFNHSAIKNYKNTTEGNSQMMLFSKGNEEDNKPLLDVFEDMKQSDENTIVYGASLSGDEGEINISQEMAEKLYDNMNKLIDEAKYLTDQKVSVSQMNNYLEKGQKNREKETKLKIKDAKESLKDFIKLEDKYSVYYIKDYKVPLCTGIKCTKENGKIIGVMPVMGMYDQNARLDKIVLKTSNDEFIFDNVYNGSIIDSIKGNGYVYNFPLYTMQKLNIDAVIQNIANASSVEFKFSADGSYDEESSYFKSTDVFKEIYEQLSEYTDKYSCLNGLSVQDL